MAITSGQRQYALGRECVMTVNGVVVSGASDVLVRETVTEIDATGFNHDSVSTLAVLRTIEIEASVPDIAAARRLYGLRSQDKGGFKVPQVVYVELSGGVVEEKRHFIISEVAADEPLEGAVIPRFIFKSWAHKPAGNAQA